MFDQHRTNSENGLYNQSVSHVSVHVQLFDTIADESADTAASADDLLAIYKCFDVLERVWPTQPGLHHTAGLFTLEEEIGRGGMGRVWSAIQHEPVKRNVAVKLINPGPQTQRMINRFESERNALALMNHPSIATLIDAGQTDDGRLYFAMELVDGPDLLSYCNLKQLNIEQRLNLFLDACAAVQHAHQKGIIHRDLKPSNILVGEVDDHARLKVIDFGLSKINSTPLDIVSQSNSEVTSSQQTDFTQDGQVIGSLRYMSPEQAAADLGSIDVRSDVYSLGVVLYKLLTDSTPLDSKDLTDASVERLLDSIQFDDDSAPSEFLSGLSKTDFEKIVIRRHTSNKVYQRILKSDLDWIAMRAISKDPDSRYQTVSDFAGDIRRFLNHEPVLARPESLLYNVKKELSKNRVLWGSVAGVIAALLSGILVAGFALASATNARNLAEKRLEQSRKSNEILAAVFADINFPSIEQETEPIEVRLGRRLVQAAEGLIIDSIGDAVEVADLKIKLVEALNGLEFYEAAVPIGRAVWDSVQGLDPAQDDSDLKYRAGIALVKSLSGNAQTLKASEVLTPLLAESVLEEGEDSETRLNLLLLKGQVAVMSNDDFEARRCFTEVANRREALWGNSDLRTLEAKFWLTDVYIEPGVAFAALPMSDEIVKQYRRLLPEGHPRTIKAILNNAWIRSDAGEFSKAVELAEEGFELATKTYGENHPTTYDAKLILGLLVHRTGKREEGARMLEEARAGLSETTGVSHPRAIMAMTVLADMSQQGGNMKRAISLLEEAVALSPPRSGIDIKLADFHNEAGNFKAARRLLETAIENAKGFPLEMETVAECLYLIGRTYNSEGKLAKAIAAFEKSIAMAPATENRHDFEGMRKVTELAGCYTELGDYDQATKIINEYLDAMPDSMGPDNRVRLCCHAELGLIFRQSGKLDEAITKFESVFKSEVKLNHHDYLVHEMRLTQVELGDTDAVLAGVDRELNFIRSAVPNDPAEEANQLKLLGYDLIEFDLLEKSIEVLTESAVIYEEALPGSWVLIKTKFDIAQLKHELEPAESDASLEAEEKLEKTWNQLAEMKQDTIPFNIRKLGYSIRAVIRVYADRSDRKSAAVWRKRLRTLR